MKADQREEKKNYAPQGDFWVRLHKINNFEPESLITKLLKLVSINIP